MQIRLGVPDEALKIGPLLAFVDSGADATIVPLHYIRQLNVQAEDSKFLRSQWGERRQVDIYWLDLGIGNLRFPAVEIIADDRSNEVETQNFTSLRRSSFLNLRTQNPHIALAPGDALRIHLFQ